jgi:hypothetical protein
MGGRSYTDEYQQRAALEPWTTGRARASSSGTLGNWPRAREQEPTREGHVVGAAGRVDPGRFCRWACVVIHWHCHAAPLHIWLVEGNHGAISGPYVFFSFLQFNLISQTGKRRHQRATEKVPFLKKKRRKKKKWELVYRATV